MSTCNPTSQTLTQAQIHSWCEPLSARRAWRSPSCSPFNSIPHIPIPQALDSHLDCWQVENMLLLHNERLEGLEGTVLWQAPRPPQPDSAQPNQTHPSPLPGGPMATFTSDGHTQPHATQPNQAQLMQQSLTNQIPGAMQQMNPSADGQLGGDGLGLRHAAASGAVALGAAPGQTREDQRGQSANPRGDPAGYSGGGELGQARGFQPWQGADPRRRPGMVQGVEGSGVGAPAQVGDRAPPVPGDPAALDCARQHDEQVPKRLRQS